jgi:hypothetical protein
LVEPPPDAVLPLDAVLDPPPLLPLDPVVELVVVALADTPEVAFAPPLHAHRAAPRMPAQAVVDVTRPRFMELPPGDVHRMQAPRA